MTLLYASVNLMLIAELPLTLNLNAYLDVNLIDIPEYPNGIYRHISRDFLRWMKARLDLAAKPESGVPPEALALRVAFFDDCCRRSGLLPSEKPLRSDYARPSESTAFVFKGNFCLWDNMRAEVQQPEKVATFELASSFAGKLSAKPQRKRKTDEDSEFSEHEEIARLGEDFHISSELAISAALGDSGSENGDPSRSVVTEQQGKLSGEDADFTPKPPHVYLLCRNSQTVKNLNAQDRKSGQHSQYPVRFFRGGQIEAGYDEFHVHGGEWHPIRPEWKLPPGCEGDDFGIWKPPEWWIEENQRNPASSGIRPESGQVRPAEISGTSVAAASNPLDDLF